MIIRHALRVAVFAYLVVGVLFLVTVFYLQKNLPNEALEYIEWWSRQPLGLVEMLISWIGVVFFIISLMAAIGLFYYYQFSMVVFIASIMILNVTKLAVKYPILLTPLEGFLESSLFLISGFIIGIICLKQIAK